MHSYENQVHIFVNTASTINIPHINVHKEMKMQIGRFTGNVTLKAIDTVIIRTFVITILSA